MKFENLSDSDFNNVVADLNKRKMNFLGKIIEIVGWVVSGLSLFLFLFSLFGWLALYIQNGSDNSFIYSLDYAASYFVAFVVSLLILAVNGNMEMSETGGEKCW